MNYTVNIGIDIEEIFEGLSEQDKFGMIKGLLYRLSEKGQSDLVKEVLSDFPEREVREITSEYLGFADTDRMISVLEEQGYKVTEE